MRKTSKAKFDFDDLEKRIVTASKRAFADVARVHPKETICAFALYSDDGAMTVCPAFDLARSLRKRQKENPDDAAYFKFSTAEWALEAFGADKAFDDICTRVRTFVLDGADGARFDAFRTKLFETCLRSLERLREDGAFDAHPGLLVMFAVSDADLDPAEEIRRIKRLNGDSPHVGEFRKWTKTWDA